MRHGGTGFLRLLMGAMLITAFTAGAARAEKTTYYVVSEDSSYGGINSSKFLEMAREIMRVAGTKLGVTFEVKLLRGEKEIFQAVKDGKADLVISGLDYPRAVAQGVPVQPWAALNINGKVGYKDCIWIAADSKFKTVADLKGKTMIGIPAVSLRKILADAGFDMPFEKFFSKFDMYRNPLRALEGVMKGAYDSYYMGTNYMDFLKFDEKFRKAFKQLACSETLYPTQFLVRKGLDPEFMKRLNLLILNAHHDPDFSAVRFVFITLNAKMALVTHADYKPNLDLYELAKKKGWLKDIEPLVQKQMQQKE